MSATVLLLIGTWPALLFSSENNKDFPLQVHIVARGRVKDNPIFIDGVMFGPFRDSYTVRIDGDPRELTMMPYSMRFPKGFHVGDYNGHWNTNGSLEIQCLDEKGKLVHWRFLSRGERLLPPETTPK